MVSGPIYSLKFLSIVYGNSPLKKISICYSRPGGDKESKRVAAFSGKWDRYSQHFIGDLCITHECADSPAAEYTCVK